MTTTPNRGLLKALLMDEDDLCVVGEGGDGRQCFKEASEIHPDVILLDLRIPGVSGIDLLPQLRDALPDTKIIMLTTAAASAYEGAAIERGAVGFIEKPRNILDLPAMIRQKLADTGLEL